MSAAEPRTAARGARSRFERTEWILLAIALINSTGSGAFAAGSVVFFTRYVGFSPARVGGALSAAALVGMVTTVPTGLVAERFGARRTLIVLHLLRTIGYSAYALVQSFPLFVGLTVLLTVMDRAATPATQAVVAGTMRAEDRVRIMSWRYAMANVGLGLGSALVAVVLAFGSRVGFQALLVFNGATFAAAALLTRKLAEAPRGLRGEAPENKARAFRREEWPDFNYLLLTAATTGLLLCEAVLTVALPVWITTRTRAPAAMVGILYTANTLLTAALQVRISQRVRDNAGAGTALFFAGVLLAVSSGLCALAAAVPAPAAMAMLLLAVAVLSLGEIATGAGSWHLSTELAPKATRERYLAVFSLSLSAERVIGPVLVTGVLLKVGDAGWGLTALIFMSCGLVGRRTGRAQGPSREAGQGSMPLRVS